ncbi:unnamed protein product [Timema podura]|uniref:CRAL-TRIO domain-containing protein n=1 Tax=Timema podura TaxID=61482 RepID=A0ABN7PCR2_TIMPD|nr:unnamed protein product [Timema podura]
MVQLPRATPEGYHVLFYRLTDMDPLKLFFLPAIKAFFMFNDVVLSDNGLKPGYVVIFDMKDHTLGHLARITLPLIRKLMYYIQPTADVPSVVRTINLCLSVTQTSLGISEGKIPLYTASSNGTYCQLLDMWRTGALTFPLPHIDDLLGVQPLAQKGGCFPEAANMEALCTDLMGMSNSASPSTHPLGEPRGSNAGTRRTQLF